MDMSTEADTGDTKTLDNSKTTVEGAKKQRGSIELISIIAAVCPIVFALIILVFVHRSHQKHRQETAIKTPSIATTAHPCSAYSILPLMKTGMLSPAIVSNVPIGPETETIVEEPATVATTGALDSIPSNPTTSVVISMVPTEGAWEFFDSVNSFVLDSLEDPTRPSARSTVYSPASS